MRKNSHSSLLDLPDYQHELLSREQESGLFSRIRDLQRKIVTELIRLLDVRRSQWPEDNARSRSLFIQDHRGEFITQALGVLLAEYDSCRSKVLSSNYRLACAVAARFYKCSKAELADKIQAAMMGIMTSIDRFELDRGNRFATFATWYARMEVGKVASLTASQLSVPADFFAALSTADPTTLAGRQLIAAHVGVRSIWEPTEAGGTTPLQTVACRSHEAIDQSQRNEAAEIIQQLLAALRPRERIAMEMRFGIGDYPVSTLADIGNKLCVSKERARQILCIAKQKLQKMLEERGVSDLNDLIKVSD